MLVTIAKVLLKYTILLIVNVLLLVLKVLGISVKLVPVVSNKLLVTGYKTTRVKG